MTRILVFLLFVLLIGCSSDANTHQALERDSSDPTVGSGGWSYPNRTWSNGRVVGNDAGAPPAVGGTAGHAGFWTADTASLAAAGQQPSATRTTTMMSATMGGSVAIGGQPTTSPTSATAIEPIGVGGVASGGTTNASAAYGGSAGIAGGFPIGGASSVATTSTRVYDGVTGPDTAMRVLFEEIAGTPKDNTIQVWVRVENRSTEIIPLKNIEVEYWGRMDPMKSIACVCQSTVCGASTVGTFRSSHGQANCGFIYAFPGFELKPGGSMLLDWNCHYSDWSAIDETTHYSYPFNLSKGEEMPRVTIQDRSAMKLLWGVLPE